MGEYNLITPPTEVIIADTQRLNEMQKHKIAAKSVFVPAQFGVLITPNSHHIFSVNEVASSDSVYDLPRLDSDIVSAETMHLFFCGALRADFGEYKILVHGAGPLKLVRLTSRALDLIQEAGKMPTNGHLSIFINSTSPHPSNNTGSTSYKSLVGEMISRRSLGFSHSQSFIDDMYRIRV